MTVLHSRELVALGDSVGSLCQRMATEERVRAVAFDWSGQHQGFDVELWQALCRQVGVGAIGVGEELGGVGGGILEQAVIAHQLGRVLAPVPFLASAVLATRILANTNAGADALAAVMGGDRCAAVVFGCAGVSPGPAVSAGSVDATAGDDGGWILQGLIRHVLGGSSADDFLVLATAGPEAAIFLVDRNEPGLRVESERALDGTRSMATVSFNAVGAQRLTPDVPLGRLVASSLRHTLAVLAAEQVGTCERILEMATDYARSREQFGRPIGSFQAIKHRCADMLIDLEMARSASQAALRVVDDDDDDHHWQVSMAKAVCAEALRSLSHANLQIHGGIGFTWEHSAGLFVRRARSDEVLFGRPGDYWDWLGIQSGLFIDLDDSGDPQVPQASEAGE